MNEQRLFPFMEQPSLSDMIQLEESSEVIREKAFRFLFREVGFTRFQATESSSSSISQDGIVVPAALPPTS